MSEKTKKISLVAFLICIVLLPAVSLALSIAPDFFTDTNPETQKLRNTPVKSAAGITDLVNQIIRWFQYIFYLVTIIFIILAAFSFLTSKGEPEKVKTAQKSLLYAVIAIAIAIIGGGLILVVKDLID